MLSTKLFAVFSVIFCFGRWASLFPFGESVWPTLAIWFFCKGGGFLTYFPVPGESDTMLSLGIQTAYK